MQYISFIICIILLVKLPLLDLTSGLEFLLESRGILEISSVILVAMMKERLKNDFCIKYSKNKARLILEYSVFIVNGNSLTIKRIVMICNLPQNADPFIY